MINILVVKDLVWSGHNMFGCIQQLSHLKQLVNLFPVQPNKLTLLVFKLRTFESRDGMVGSTINDKNYHIQKTNRFA